MRWPHTPYVINWVQTPRDKRTHIVVLVVGGLSWVGVKLQWKKNSLLKDLARTPFERRSLLNFGSFTWWSGFLSKQRFDLQLFLKNVWWQWSQRVINYSEEMLTRHFCPPIRQSVRNSGHAEGGWQQSPNAFRNSYDTPPPPPPPPWVSAKTMLARIKTFSYWLLPWFVEYVHIHPPHTNFHESHTFS